MTSALQGLRVVELGQWIAAPYCTSLLADFGAEVVKVEKPGGDDQRRSGPPTPQGDSAFFSVLNRNKRSVVLDFAVPQDCEACLRLIESADIVVENYRPGVLSRFGLDYEALSARYPRLIYCSISGFGQTGPMRAEGGFDLVAQAMSGLASICGRIDGPPEKMPIPLVDVSTGLFATIGVLTALQARHATGRGQLVDISLMESALSLAPLDIGHVLATGANPPRLGDASRNAAPYQIFPTKDSAIALGAASQHLWERTCQLIGRSDLLQDARFATNLLRMEHIRELAPEISAALRLETTAHWLQAFKEVGVPVGPVLGFCEALNMPQLQERQLVRRPESPDNGDFPSLVAPVRLTDTPARLRIGAPRLGQHQRLLNEEF